MVENEGLWGEKVVIGRYISVRHNSLWYGSRLAGDRRRYFRCDTECRQMCCLILFRDEIC